MAKFDSGNIKKVPLIVRADVASNISLPVNNDSKAK